jgi:hypothetical protein
VEVHIRDAWMCGQEAIHERQLVPLMVVQTNCKVFQSGE